MTTVKTGLRADRYDMENEMIMPDTVIHTSSEKETFEFAKKLGQNAEKGSIYGLIGDLGAGKSVFARGFAAGLGVTEYVSSPTFNILNVYETGRLALYHFDVYRIEDPDEMYETGFDEYFGGDGICLVEWSDMIRELMPEGYIRVELTKDPEDMVSGRCIRIREKGTKK